MEEILKLKEDEEVARYAVITSLQYGAYGVLIFEVAVDSVPKVLYLGETQNLDELLNKYR